MKKDRGLARSAVEIEVCGASKSRPLHGHGDKANTTACVLMFTAERLSVCHCFLRTMPMHMNVRAICYI